MHREFDIVSKTLGTHTVLIDEEDWNEVNQYTWTLTGKGAHIYARTNVPCSSGEYYIDSKGTKRKRYKKLLMHRMIVDCPPDEVVDHINHNTLDNRKSNLQVGPHKMNSENRVIRKHNKLGRGVYYLKKGKNMINEHSKPYRAMFNNKGKSICLGFYKTNEEAKIAWDRKACQEWNIVNPKLILNFPERYDEYMADLEKNTEKNSRSFSDQSNSI